MIGDWESIVPFFLPRKNFFEKRGETRLGKIGFAKGTRIARGRDEGVGWEELE